MPSRWDTLDLPEVKEIDIVYIETIWNHIILLQVTETSHVH